MLRDSSGRIVQLTDATGDPLKADLSRTYAMVACACPQPGARMASSVTPKLTHRELFRQLLQNARHASLSPPSTWLLALHCLLMAQHVIAFKVGQGSRAGRYVSAEALQQKYSLGILGCCNRWDTVNGRMRGELGKGCYYKWEAPTVQNWARCSAAGCHPGIGTLPAGVRCHAA